MDEEPSALKNYTGGTGCGCGCLGMLVMLLAGIAMALIPLQVYDETQVYTVWISVGVASAVGVLTFLLGVGLHVGSWFLK